MATFPVRHGISFPAQELERTNPNLNYEAGSLRVILPYRATPEFNGVIGYNSTTSYKSYQQTQIQEIIDMLHVCAEEASAREIKAAHAYVLKSDFMDKNLVLRNHMAHAYSKCSKFKAAQAVFNNMSERNIFSWTVMIMGSTENGLFYDGFKYFCDMLNSGLLPDTFAYSAIIQLCIRLDNVDLGKMVHSQIVVRGFTSHVFINTSLLNMYSKLGEVEDSCRVFNNMTEHSEVSWNAIISGLTSNGFHSESFMHFLRMKEERFSLNMYTFVGVMKAVGNLGDVSKGKEVHECVSELGMESNIMVGTALIDMYSECGALNDARSVFDTNFSNCGLNMPWNAIISGYSRSGFSREALELYVKMCRKNIKCDLYTYCSVFNAISDLRVLKFEREVHGRVLKSGYHWRHLSIGNAIMDAYSKCGSLEDVQKVFDRMEGKDVVSWTTLVTAYSQCSEWEEALAIFSEMREKGFMPNDFTFSSVLVASAGLCSLEYGRQVHGLLCKTGLNTERCIGSALLDMYAKCGSITEAHKVFNGISNPDVVSWTAIVWGYAQHGSVDYAVQLFRRMEQLGVKANAVTFLCVLFACSHGGMIEEGLHYFRAMEESYGVVPEMEHYTCIVDLLGRVGRLKEAFEFIRKMPIEPNEMIWQTLLGACRIHGNIELGEIAAQKLLSVLPEHSAGYVLLSNAYMETGSLKEGFHLRNVMKERGVKKEPGYSWIFVKGRNHKFYAGDQEHQQKDEIYLVLDDWRTKIKAMGYKPDLRYFFQVED